MSKAKKDLAKIMWERSVVVSQRDSLQEYYASLPPCGEAAVVKGKLTRMGGVITGLDIAIDLLTPVEGK